MLEEDVRLFQEYEAWSAPGMSIDPGVRTVFEARAAAERSRAILESVLTRVDHGAQYYREQAEKAGMELQQDIEAGTIRPEDLDEELA